MYMKRNAPRADLCLVLCGVLIWLLADAGRVRLAAAEALTLCARTVIPALFPFMAVSGMLVSLGFGEWLSPRLAGLMGLLFHLPGSAGSALLLGLVGGYPIGARTAAALYRENLLTRDEAQRLLSFCNNSNPVFLISVLGAGVFSSPRTGIYLWLIHILSALLTGMLFRGRKTSVRKPPPAVFPCRTVRLTSVWVSSVQNALSGILSVCAFVVLFYVVLLPLRSISGNLGTALIGTIELFSLTPLLENNRCSFLLSAFCAGWGGLSVLAQTAAILDDTDLSLKPCIYGKAVQGILSALLAALVWQFVL